MLASESIFKSASKGDKASAADIKEAFGQEDQQAVLKTIVEKGELQLSAAERKEFVEKRRAEVVNYIHKVRCLFPLCVCVKEIPRKIATLSWLLAFASLPRL